MALDIDERKVRRNEFGLWLGWTLATAAGMLLGLLPIALIVEDLDLGLARVLVPLLAGFLVGFFQWLVLRQFLTHTVDWILSGGAGWALGYGLGLLIIQALAGSFLGALAGYLLFGAIIALVQWPVLRREIPNPLPWILASVVGWALGALGSQLILDLVVTGDQVSQLLSTGLIATFTGLIAGAITGLVLVWIARQPDLPQTDR